MMPSGRASGAERRRAGGIVVRFGPPRPSRLAPRAPVSGSTVCGGTVSGSTVSGSTGSGGRLARQPSPAGPA